MVYVLQSTTRVQQMDLILAHYVCVAMNANLLQSVKGTVWYKATKKTHCAAKRAYVMQSGVFSAENSIPKSHLLLTVLQRKPVSCKDYLFWKGVLYLERVIVCCKESL